MERQQIFVVDTSVVIKWYIQEINSPKAKELLLKFKHNKIRLIGPELLMYEFCNVISHKFSLDDAREAHELLSAANIELTPSYAALMRRTIELAHKYNISGYDACFVALSQLLEVPLLTADEKLQRKVGKNVQLLATAQFS